MCTLVFVREAIEHIMPAAPAHEDDGMAWTGCIISSTHQPLSDIHFRVVYYDYHTLQLRGDSASELPFWMHITINLHTEVVTVKGRLYAFTQRLNPAAFRLVSSLETRNNVFLLRMTSLAFDWFSLEITLQ